MLGVLAVERLRPAGRRDLARIVVALGLAGADDDVGLRPVTPRECQRQEHPDDHLFHASRSPPCSSGSSGLNSLIIVPISGHAIDQQQLTRTVPSASDFRNSPLPPVRQASISHPQLPVQRSVLDGLLDMVGLDVGGVVQRRWCAEASRMRSYVRALRFSSDIASFSSSWLASSSRQCTFKSFGNIRDFWARSAFVAAVFAIHPLRVESVAWVAERKDVLSGLFFMLTLWAYTRYVQVAGGK